MTEVMAQETIEQSAELQPDQSGKQERYYSTRELLKFGAPALAIGSLGLALVMHHIGYQDGWAARMAAYGHAPETKPPNGSQVTTTLSTTPETSTIELMKPTTIALKDFRAKEQLPEKVTETMNSASVLIKIPLDTTTVARCSGLIINDYLFMAGHCMATYTKEKGDVVITDPRTGQHTRLVEWFSDQVTDLTIGKVEDSNLLPGVNVPSFATEAPKPGSRALISSYPTDSQKAVVGGLTFIKAEVTDHQGGKAERWIYAVDPEFKGSRKVCDSGSSGATITDGNGFVAIMAETTEVEPGTTIDTDDQTIQLDGSKELCFGVPLKQVTINEYIKALNK